ncbi:MAG: hypothetical protein MJ197_09730 [Bacteroidales bacterium]|nr:hypothetical protein [Bacteroidales bacterium]
MAESIKKNVSSIIVDDFVNSKMLQPGLCVVYARCKYFADHYDVFNYYKVVCLDDNGKAYTYTKMLSSFDSEWKRERN